MSDRARSQLVVGLGLLGLGCAEPYAVKGKRAPQPEDCSVSGRLQFVEDRMLEESSGLSTSFRLRSSKTKTRRNT